MNNDDYPARVTLFEDGVYRWSYDLDLWQNRYMLKLIVKILGIIFVIPVAFSLLMILSRSVPLLLDHFPWRMLLAANDSNLKLLGLFSLILAGVLLLTVIIYAICALVMRGKYHLSFKMDQSAVVLVRTARSKNTVDALAGVATAAAFVAGKPGEAMRTGAMLAGANAVGTTRFDAVTSLKEYPGYDMLELREWFGMNQIYVNQGDYPYVRDFIMEHIREKAKTH